MRKLLVGGVTTALLVTSLGTNTAFAFQNDESSIPQTSKVASVKQKEQEKKEYSYVYNGIPISSSEPLSEDHLKFLYSTLSPNNSPVVNQVSNPLLNKANGISAYVVVNPGDGGQVVDPPRYTTFSNLETRILISAAAQWVTSKIPRIPGAISWAIASATFWAGEIAAPNYISTWTYRAYDSYNGRYRIYGTLVRYKYGNYTSPVSVQTRPLD
ncbi:hypothetical protein P6P90_09450 [Ectobacillus antri]|jgi:hypothetical protein|uniref:Surface layer protein A domain-containing protein n=1 Tax=Ectobacillus antri TaxID=2486280 RepID=A0ABT6H4P7_9BACI|nr:hypothetical protein [Ectobacillus antri]MDG4656909.1 hypothetical protein [Ectobacillus antri]MDG5754194.1 hypothetical protein [Ectobacillus antri]